MGEGSGVGSPAAGKGEGGWGRVVFVIEGGEGLLLWNMCVSCYDVG